MSYFKRTGVNLRVFRRSLLCSELPVELQFCLYGAFKKQLKRNPDYPFRSIMNEPKARMKGKNSLT